MLCLQRANNVFDSVFVNKFICSCCHSLIFLNFNVPFVLFMFSAFAIVFNFVFCFLSVRTVFG